jgi:cobyrinic acid a,c-diamide synthase
MFCFGSQGSDLSIVVGSYSGHEAGNKSNGGTLDALCHWLDLPQVVVLDVAKIGPCQLPRIPNETAAVLLDRVASMREWVHWQTLIESHTSARVLGALRPCPRIREQLSWCAKHGANPAQLIRQLADDLSESIQLEELLRLANQQPFAGNDDLDITPTYGRYGLNVAIAYDDAFNCYFPDTLDALEMQGARLCDFSPLKGDKLPARCDLVLFGCGHPERFADVLARNICMKQALQTHARSGRRVYAEGGGLAYISRQMICRSSTYEMAGLLPSVARYQRSQPTPIELRLARDSWLGEADRVIRGYQNSCWVIESAGGLSDYAVDPRQRHNLVGYRQIIGSRLHLHFSTHPSMLQNLLRPLRVAHR